MAAEHPGRPLGPERPRPGANRRPSRHNRTIRRRGQRVMRHFLPAAAILQLTQPAALAVPPLALRVLVTAAAAVLVAAPGTAQRTPPRLSAAPRRAVDVAVIATPAQNHLTVAQGAEEQAGGGSHRSGRRERGGPPPKTATYCAYGLCLAWLGGAAPVVAWKQTGPAPHRSQLPQSTPAAALVRPLQTMPESCRPPAVDRWAAAARLLGVAAAAHLSTARSGNNPKTPPPDRQGANVASSRMQRICALLDRHRHPSEALGVLRSLREAYSNPPFTPPEFIRDLSEKGLPRLAAQTGERRDELEGQA